MPTRSPKHVPNPTSPAPVHQFRRPSITKLGYDSAWSRFRRWFAGQVPPVCVQCGHAGADGDGTMHLDHITPLASGGQRLDPANVQWLCVGCHSRKTAREDGGFGRAKAT